MLAFAFFFASKLFADLLEKVATRPIRREIAQQRATQPVTIAARKAISAAIALTRSRKSNATPAGSPDIFHETVRLAVAGWAAEAAVAVARIKSVTSAAKSATSHETAPLTHMEAVAAVAAAAVVAGTAVVTEVEVMAAVEVVAVQTATRAAAMAISHATAPRARSVTTVSLPHVTGQVSSF